MYLGGFGVVEYDQNILQEIFKELIKILFFKKKLSFQAVPGHVKLAVKTNHNVPSGTS